MIECMQNIKDIKNEYIIRRVKKNLAVMLGWINTAAQIKYLQRGMHVKDSEHYNTPKVTFHSKYLSHSVREIIDLAFLRIFNLVLYMATISFHRQRAQI